jgi:CBS domain-containing protein
MRSMSELLPALTAADLMTRDMVLVPEEMPLREAAVLLRRAQISGTPVVDRLGRCVGVLSTADFLRWAEEERRGKEQVPIPACPYQVKGRLLTGEKAVICTLAEGACPLQVVRPTVGGRYTALCSMPSDTSGSRQEGLEELPSDSVHHFMTTALSLLGQILLCPDWRG